MARQPLSGWIRPGLRADLVLVDGDPAVDVTASRTIVGVWKAGVGAGWTMSTDSMMGGASTAEMTTVEGGAADTNMSMLVTGTIVSGAGPAMWAGPMFFPGVQQLAPANMSEHEGFSFWVRGDGAAINLMLFAQSLGQMPSLMSVPVTAEWTEHRLAFADFAGIDAIGLQTILFSGADAGDFEFQIDEFRVW